MSSTNLQPRLSPLPARAPAKEPKIGPTLFTPMLFDPRAPFEKFQPAIGADLRLEWDSGVPRDIVMAKEMAGQKERVARRNGMHPAQLDLSYFEMSNPLLHSIDNCNTLAYANPWKNKWLSDFSFEQIYEAAILIGLMKLQDKRRVMVAGSDVDVVGLYTHFLRDVLVPEGSVLTVLPRPDERMVWALKTAGADDWLSPGCEVVFADYERLGQRISKKTGRPWHLGLDGILLLDAVKEVPATVLGYLDSVKGGQVVYFKKEEMNLDGHMEQAQLAQAIVYERAAGTGSRRGFMVDTVYPTQTYKPDDIVSV